MTTTGLADVRFESDICRMPTTTPAFVAPNGGFGEANRSLVGHFGTLDESKSLR